MLSINFENKYLWCYMHWPMDLKKWAISVLSYELYIWFTQDYYLWWYLHVLALGQMNSVVLVCKELFIIGTELSMFLARLRLYCFEGFWIFVPLQACSWKGSYLVGCAHGVGPQSNKIHFVCGFGRGLYPCLCVCVLVSSLTIWLWRLFVTGVMVGIFVTID